MSVDLDSNDGPSLWKSEEVTENCVSEVGKYYNWTAQKLQVCGSAQKRPQTHHIAAPKLMDGD